MIFNHHLLATKTIKLWEKPCQILAKPYGPRIQKVLLATRGYFRPIVASNCGVKI
jgi:hypothetical protein